MIPLMILDSTRSDMDSTRSDIGDLRLSSRGKLPAGARVGGIMDGYTDALKLIALGVVLVVIVAGVLIVKYYSA